MPVFLVITIGLSLLPDLDAVFGIVFKDFGKFHNSASHSMLLGLPVALLGACVAWVVVRENFLRWFLFVLLCWETHIFMDLFTVTRGVMIFWPLSDARFQSPIKLFIGLQWSAPLRSPLHLLTLVNEGAFVLIVFAAWRFFAKKRSVPPAEAAQH